MARAGREVVFLLLHRQAGRDVERGARLADAGNIVTLALDRQDRGVGDGAEVHQLAAVHEFALRQRVLLEHLFHRLEVEFRRHVADAAVFLVEILGLLRALVVAGAQVFEHLVMAHHVLAQVHGHEPGQLQEARIDAPSRAFVLQRHGGDHLRAEPRERALHGKVVDRGGRLARVDRPAHHGQRRGAVGIARLCHHRRCRQRGDAGLAHGEHVRIRPDHAEEVDQVIDVIVEVEIALVDIDAARIGPVGDPDFRAFHHPRNRAAQQRGVMPAHRGDDQQAGRIFGQAIALEMPEVAERAALDHGFGDRHVLPVHGHGLDPEGGLAVACRSVGKHVERARHHRRETEVAERVARIGQPLRADSRPGAGAGQELPLHLVSVVKHCNPLLAARTGARGRFVPAMWRFAFHCAMQQRPICSGECGLYRRREAPALQRPTADVRRP